MGHRLSKIYTRTGDDGTTGLGDGTRTQKDSLRVEAYGTVDELNSAIGVVIAALPGATDDGSLSSMLLDVQHDLFDIGGELCIPDTTLIGDRHIERLENELDRINADLPPLKDFILPGGNLAAAQAHLARTICRRAERRVIALARHEAVSDTLLRYLNRLSDLLFVLARSVARATGTGEILWDHDRDR
ncbi:cob(I)yrinic acid a,c-diamide adenosyltransferase [Wenzhouxiangella sp. XN79A]|uniref:cob(I)yrinic acid a,c-diamide adenosyltransferase n=1 Tax=Wenzhouxiangella sp. XN79A TaxID=2724193 RepID=UPI00144ABCD7|nr:cob(I)yrinic acid a,c-diamide adenosyltransferase [Wenzhouxiangella sp. XN79A]NKI34578.1 cob(I)yrinic acid a,c-diamide adenosyltransferase [Wenzhouxiangella sp. XN79A]